MDENSTKPSEKREEKRKRKLKCERRNQEYKEEAEEKKEKIWIVEGEKNAKVEGGKEVIVEFDK